MPLEIYQYKPGSRSTPKLRRNQSNNTYRHGNASVDSFTSLCPSLPASFQSLQSPASALSPPFLESDGRIPSWHGIDAPSPPRDADPAHSKPMTIITFPEGTNTIERVPVPPPKDALSSEECTQQVKALRLKPAQVAVFRNRSGSTSSGASSTLTQIYNSEAKVITDSFDGLGDFERMYMKDERGHRKSRWATWSRRLLRKPQTTKHDTHEVEIWHRRD